jgi:acyl-CoA synthetase (AMP-forming)/AMP-acid ligase II
LTNIILADWDWIEGDGRTLDTDQLPAVQANDPCRIVLMPVTSDKRNGIALTHRTIAQRLGYHCFFGKRSASCSRIYCDLPLTSEQGFRWIIYTLWRGGTVFLPGKTFETTLKSFEDYKTQCLVSSPDGLENLVKWFGAAPDYQTKIETIVCAEGMLTKSLSERVRTQMCSHLVSTYGMIETGVFAVANAQEIVDISGAVGFVTPNAVVKISNASGKLLPTGQEGFISIRSDVAAEYFDGRDDATGVFRDEWFQTTTVGALSSDNVLTLV